MVKNIIFDFGAVLLPIDEHLSWKALDELGATHELRNQTRHFRDYETGKLTTAEFLEKTRPYFFRKKIFSGDLKQAWNAMLYQPLETEKVDFLKSLRRKGFKLFLLSNTNEMHIDAIRETAGPFLHTQFIKQFEEVYYSYEAGMRKPDEAIFQKVIDDHQLVPEETFFVDDKKENVDAAASLGLHTWHFNPENEDILTLLKRLKPLETI